MKYQLSFFARTHLFCVVHYAPFSIRLFARLRSFLVEISQRFTNSKIFSRLNIDSNFLPISLTPILSKILESFPYRWLLQSVSNQIDPLQFGSQRGSSASMALVHLLHKSYEACDDLGSSLRICLLDFSKAFDRVDRNVLLKKLVQMAVHPVLINWIADFFSNRLQRTKIDQDYSDWKHIQAGVPQGTKLGPLLFLIMVNDLIQAMTLSNLSTTLQCGKFCIVILNQCSPHP